MPRIIFLLTFIISSAAIQADQTSVTTSKALRERVGFTEITKKYPSLDGSGIRIGLLDHFWGYKEKKGPTQLRHGYRVEQAVKWFAPGAEIIRREREKETNVKPSDNLHVVNVSTHLQMQDAVELARSGTIIVYAAGNESRILGADYGKPDGLLELSNNYKYEIANRINNDASIPGAVIIVGSGVPKQQNKSDEGLSIYSNMAGIARDWYLFVRASRIADIVAMEEPIMTKMPKEIDIGDDLLAEHKNILRKDRVSRALTEIGLYTGTSFAAPAVCGLLALGLQAFPDVPAKEIAMLLLKEARLNEHPSVPELIQRRLFNSTSLTASQIKELSPEDIYGRGEIDFGAFFKKAEELWKDYEVSKNGWLKQGRWAIRTQVLVPPFDQNLAPSLHVSMTAFGNRSNDIIMKSQQIYSGVKLNEALELNQKTEDSLFHKSLIEGKHKNSAAKMEHFKTVYHSEISRLFEIARKTPPEKRKLVSDIINVFDPRSGKDDPVVVPGPALLLYGYLVDFSGSLTAADRKLVREFADLSNPPRTKDSALWQQYYSEQLLLESELFLVAQESRRAEVQKRIYQMLSRVIDVSKGEGLHDFFANILGARSGGLPIEIVKNMGVQIWDACKKGKIETSDDKICQWAFMLAF